MVRGSTGMSPDGQGVEAGNVPGNTVDGKILGEQVVLEVENKIGIVVGEHRFSQRCDVLLEAFVASVDVWHRLNAPVFPL